MRLLTLLLLLLLQVLIEAGQQLPDGRMRQRCLPLSEKMIGQEGWQAAAVRAVSEELATALPQEWKTHVRVCFYALAADECWCCSTRRLLGPRGSGLRVLGARSPRSAADTTHGACLQ